MITEVTRLENGSIINDFHYNDKDYTVIEILNKGIVAMCNQKYMDNIEFDTCDEFINFLEKDI